MSLRFYPAAVFKDGTHGFSIHILDIPLAHSAGETIEEALRMGQEALSLAVEHMADEGETIPEPTAIDRAKVSADMKKGYGKLVGVYPVQASLPGRAVKVTISMDEELLRRVDTVAGKYGRSRFLASAAKAKLAEGA